MNPDAVLAYRVDELERDVAPLKPLPGQVQTLEINQTKLETSINRLTWAIVGFAFTVAASVAALVVSIAAGGIPT